MKFQQIHGTETQNNSESTHEIARGMFENKRRNRMLWNSIFIFIQILLTAPANNDMKLVVQCLALYCHASSVVLYNHVETHYVSGYKIQQCLFDTLFN